jgi:FMN phosphatase YigB (HAD superfamily)
VDSLSTAIDREQARAAVARWSDFPGVIDREVLDLIFSFGPSAPIALLTNATTRLNSDLAMLGLTDRFSSVFNSSEIGCCKPDVRIFQIAVQKLNCVPSEVLFIDDSLSHVESAKSVGLTVHHFRGFQNLSDFLRVFNGGTNERTD